MSGSRAMTGLSIAAIASGAAAVLHAAAAGIHADHAGLVRLFAALAIAQLGVAVAGFVRTDRTACASIVAVNGAAVVGWLLTRLVGISWIGGLEVAEQPRLADTIAALLAAAAVAAAASCALGRAVTLSGGTVASSAVLAGILLVPGLADATTHDHGDHDGHADHGAQDESALVVGAGAGGHDDHDDDHDHDAPGDIAADDAETTGSDHDDHAHDAPGDIAADGAETTGSDHDDHAHDAPGEGAAVTGATTSAGDGHDHAELDDDAADPSAWPRPWDPTGPVDFSGVEGVSAEQQARAEQLVRDTLRDLPAFADVDSLDSLGYRSIGDASTGHEHYINTTLINDDRFLDPTAPESLVFEVNGDDRTLVSAMFIAAGTPIDDPELTEFAGPLMQWHVHDNLCWGLNEEGVPVVKGVLENFGGTCPEGTVNAGGENPMVHVWIAPHECGPFAALEGHGAGQASVSDGARMDQCDHGHGADGHDEHDATGAATVPYDPELPIDLGGVPGVTPQQQAFAENLVAATIRDLPQWADLDAVEAAGFRSIGDGATGHEHYIQWDWIDDDVWLDPDYPESLVFEPRPDGSKQLVSAMFMLPSDTALDEVPDWGGALMQWHVHGDLCFTDDPVAPQVAGVKPLGTSCSPPLVDGTLAPMIHVWIRPHECGPFAALDGIAGGQVPDGEEILCDHAHGSH